MASTAEEALAAEVTVEKEAEDVTEAVPGPRSREIVVTRGGLVARCRRSMMKMCRLPALVC